MAKPYVQALDKNNTGGASAWLDVLQGVSGLILTLFMWAHMIMVSSILLGKDAMYFVARMFEGEPFLGKPYPILVSMVSLLIITMFVVHAVAAVRKMPSSYREYRLFSKHSSMFKHGDTRLWLVQVITGFVLMLLVCAHLYQMLVHPSDIGPYASADRVWSGNWWPFYLIVLFAVEFHGGIGVYRLALKWGWFMDSFGRLDRTLMHRVKWGITGFLLALGILTLAAYMKLGYEHRHQVGERYMPHVSVQVDAHPEAGH
jgi:fumarate reductase subunit C